MKKEHLEVIKNEKQKCRLTSVPMSEKSVRNFFGAEPSTSDDALSSLIAAAAESFLSFSVSFSFFFISWKPTPNKEKINK